MLHGIVDPAQRRRLVGKPGQAAACPAPSPAQRDITGLDTYYTDSAASVVDPQRLKAYQEQTKGLAAFSAAIARLADTWITTQPASPAAAACLLSWLDGWASGGAMLGDVSAPNGEHQRKWILAGAALAYLKIRDAPSLDAGAKQRVEQWMSSIATSSLRFYARYSRSSYNNHIWWLALAVAATAVATSNDAMFDRAIAYYRIALDDIAPDGTMPNEMIRKGRAIIYHVGALTPLVYLAEFGEANGLPLYAEKDGALHRLADRVRDGLADPAWFAAKTGVEQQWGDASSRSWSVVWAEPYYARFPDPLLAPMIEKYRPIFYPWLGGSPTYDSGPRAWRGCSRGAMASKVLPAAALSASAPHRPDAGHLKYRPDIDGLRAIAVTFVVLFHARVSSFPGGFVGVDVFFVISGYLITLLIRQQVEQGRFSFARFYERRIRRIAPAFLAAIAFTALLCFIYQMPADLNKFAFSLLATLLSVSNFYFWMHSGYFDLPAAHEPLLQTWSLAIEEQFYLCLPAMLAVGTRFVPKLVRPGLVVIAILSFAASVVTVDLHPETAFYMLHTRAWELLLGGLIAYDMIPSFTSAWWRNIATLLGLGLIGWSIIFYKPSIPFPGLAALPPCLGTGLIIAAGRSGSSLVSRALSLRPVVFVGLISYSLYLWHWPIVLFQRSDSILIDGTPFVGKVAIIVASFAAGTLSWAFVERPFRRSDFLTRRQVFLGAGAGALVMAGVAWLLAVAPPRYPPEVAAMAAHLTDGAEHLRDGTCFLSNRYPFSAYDGRDCMTAASDRPNYLLVGDSHAAHLWYGLSHAALPGINVMQATAAGCKPVLADTGGARTCNRLMDRVFDDYLATHKVDRLLISASWTASDLPALAQTLEWARQRNIPTVLFGPIATYDEALPHLLAMAIYRHEPGLAASHRAGDDGLDAKMAALAAKYGVEYVSLRKLLCPDGTCIVMADANTPLQFDESHLTQAGSLLVGRMLSKQGLLP